MLAVKFVITEQPPILEMEVRGWYNIQRGKMEVEYICRGGGSWEADKGCVEPDKTTRHGERLVLGGGWRWGS